MLHVISAAPQRPISSVSAPRCAPSETRENRVSGTTAAFLPLRPSCSGFDEGFIFPVLLPRPQTVPLRGSHRPKIFGLERRIRPQLFQSKWIGFAAPLAPGRIFTGGSWLKWREVPESSVLLTPPYVQSVRGSARAQTTEIAKFGYFSSTSLESSAAARFDL